MELGNDELMDRIEPLVILGDAGMGKTALLERLSTADGARFVTARKLLREPDPRLLVGDAGCLIIDALDEVPAAKDGEAVDRVLRQLVLAGQPRFILSCRIDDWRSVTATSGIEEDYGAKPLELHIEPFDAEEAERFLSHALTPQRASEVVVHFAELGLGDLLGNPQTLIMVEEVRCGLVKPVDGRWPVRHVCCVDFQVFLEEHVARCGSEGRFESFPQRGRVGL